MSDWNFIDVCIHGVRETQECEHCGFNWVPSGPPVTELARPSLAAPRAATEPPPASLRELSEKATPGPWYSEDGSAMLSPRVGSEGHRRGVGDFAFAWIDNGPMPDTDQAQPDDDVRFIAAAVNYVRDALRAAPRAATEPLTREVIQQAAQMVISRSIPEGDYGPGTKLTINSWDIADAILAALTTPTSAPEPGS